MIPFLSLTRQYAGIANDVEQAVLATLRSGHYVLGEPVENFETDFAAYCGTDHAVAVNSGTSALQLALLAGRCRTRRRGDHSREYLHRHPSRPLSRQAPGRCWSMSIRRP